MSTILERKIKILNNLKTKKKKKPNKILLEKIYLLDLFLDISLFKKCFSRL